MARRNSKEQEKIQTANEFTDCRDIKKNVLYTKSGYLIGYIRIMPINIELLSKSEIKARCNTLAAAFKSLDHPFTIISIPRSVDMEEYIGYLNVKYEEEMENQYRKKLLKIMLKEASDKVMNDDNFEHQYYAKVWEKSSSTENKEAALSAKLSNMAGRYEMIQNETKRANDEDIIKLCNLFAHSNSATFEDVSEADYVPISTIKE